MIWLRYCATHRQKAEYSYTVSEYSYMDVTGTVNSDDPDSIITATLKLTDNNGPIAICRVN